MREEPSPPGPGRTAGLNATPVDNLGTLRRYVQMTMDGPHTDNGDWNHDEL